jgi:hypothetical protein
MMKFLIKARETLQLLLDIKYRGETPPEFLEFLKDSINLLIDSYRELFIV